MQAFDLLTYVNSDISFRGPIPSRSLPGGGGCCSQNEVITLEVTAVTPDMSSQARENSLVLSSRSALKGGSQ